MNVDFSLVVGMLIVVFVSALAWQQNRKLDEIHRLVNSRLSKALQTIEDLKGLLVEKPSDARIKLAITKNS